MMGPEPVSETPKRSVLPRVARSGMPSMEHLLAVVAVARVGSFTRAAIELNLSQPALSRQIMGFEKLLGVRLFERVGRTVRLTPGGEEIVQRVAPFLDELQKVAGTISASSGTAVGRVRLGASESVAVNALPQILRPYLQANRRVNLKLVCRTSERLPEMVIAGDLEIAVCAIEYEPPGITVRKLWTEELVLVLPMSHPSRSRSIKSYVDEEFILLNQSTVTRRLLDRSLLELGIQLKVVLEHDSPEVIKSMVMAGLGIALLPEPTVRREARRGELAAWPLSDLRVVRSIVALTDARRQPWPAELALIEALAHYGR